MKTVRAKFQVDANDNGFLAYPVVATEGVNPENDAFFDATPSGKLELYTTLPVLDHLKPGDEFYIDITPAPSSE